MIYSFGLSYLILEIISTYFNWDLNLLVLMVTKDRVKNRIDTYICCLDNCHFDFSACIWAISSCLSLIKASVLAMSLQLPDLIQQADGLSLNLDILFWYSDHFIRNSDDRIPVHHRDQSVNRHRLF